MGEHFYEPKAGHGLAHDPFKAIVAPRPIGWISTVDREGRRNLAPYSFFNAFCESPPIVGFSSYGRKHSQANIEATGEFVWNLATRALAEQMNATSAAVGHGVDEFVLAGLKAAASRLVKPARVAASPVSFECRLTEMLPIRDLEGRATKNTLVLGQVIAVHIDTEYLTSDGLFDMVKARPIARCGYRGDYAEVDHLFEMFRPGG
jgi:flavin reductase (DIM6/NTAB) family NADH-FMN oxidoreductase RutF